MSYLGTKPANQIVNSDQIADGAVGTNDIANNAVTVSKLSATGTPDSTTFLRGDGSWQSVAPTTTQVLSATAGATVGAVGTYAWLGDASTVQTTPGSTRAGSNLWYAGLSADTSWSNQLPGGTTAQGGSFGGQPSGTWRAMGLSQPRDNNTRFPVTLWLRIS